MNCDFRIRGNFRTVKYFFNIAASPRRVKADFCKAKTKQANDALDYFNFRTSCTGYFLTLVIVFDGRTIFRGYFRTKCFQGELKKNLSPEKFCVNSFRNKLTVWGVDFICKIMYSQLQFRYFCTTCGTLRRVNVICYMKLWLWKISRNLFKK